MGGGNVHNISKVEILNRVNMSTTYFKGQQYYKEGKTANEPFYPIASKESNDIYQKYKSDANKYGNIVLCGRLAEFEYFNMDKCIEHAFEKMNEIESILRK